MASSNDGGSTKEETGEGLLDNLASENAAEAPAAVQSLIRQDKATNNYASAMSNWESTEVYDPNAEPLNLKKATYLFRKT